ncbi:class I SAM-dependent methyltransferase [Sinorhizobium medicae]|uniref:class I SAM-dependent methyltransferase n=1 Tax=Sinorhizobium medicae TaxID=110321 RepID=UPI001AAECB81|nr:class I SAM-dependent methyltransferase [Sinorhizobium medicae]MBO1965319.1 class I SAM-dependent methyltransferase [Sinorhizobium medicae]WQO56788.1 class I SAM-dependent methyltransferase [Sinorhizobium medicae]WQP41135.1 class I SAM-dependent methyltransferase [Sinorhizobium medicae]
MRTKPLSEKRPARRRPAHTGDRTVASLHGPADSARTSSDLFPIEEVFNADYLYFIQNAIAEERSNEDAQLISRLLGLKSGDRLLDLGCGDGRIAVRLAEMGAQVVGVDIIPLFLQEARRSARERGVSVRFLEGDMRRLPVRWTGTFDAVILWYTAFGYFDESTNSRVLEEIYRILKKGGRVVIDQAHRNAIVRREFPVQEVTDAGQDIMFTTSDYDPRTDRVYVRRSTIKDGVRRDVDYSLRIYSFVEMKELLARIGFSSVDGLGEAGTPLTLSSPRILCLAER